MPKIQTHQNNASEKLPLYNSRVTKNYLLYIKTYYPDIDTNALLNEVGIASYQVEDPAHWFSQEEVDRFHDIVIQKTGDPNISREVGRFSASHKGMGAAKQYVIGLMTPATLFNMMEKNYLLLSRGSDIHTKKIGPDRVEIISVPKPGVHEKPYQCANRTGLFESLAQPFTDKFAIIEHPECYHRGDSHCRYIVAWEESPPLIWKRLRNLVLVIGLVVNSGLFFFLPFSIWVIMVLLSAFFTALIAYNSERLSRIALTKTVEDQRDAAQDTLSETEIRYNNAMLVQEIGQATSKILDIDVLIKTVIGIMEKRLDFDRGMIMLADKKHAVLKYSAGYGHNRQQEDLLRKSTFNLSNPDSKGIFILAMKERRPFMVNNIEEIEDSLSQKSLKLARQLDSHSLICVPIVYEKDALGILAVDNSKSRRPQRQSDMSLLIGTASQLAISIINALSFEKLQESEKKYRELVETANSIILRMDKNCTITFFNEFAQRFFGYNETKVIGKNAESILLPGNGADNGGFTPLIAAMQNDPDPPVISENQTILATGETAWIAWTYKPIFDDNGDFREILCIGNDITALKHADQEKKDLQAQLQRAQKMEAIGTLAGGVAHDLNNILSGIVSYPELLLMDLDDNSPLRKPILTIQKSGEKAAAIVQDLLTLARRGVETTEVINLNQVITEYLNSPEYAKLELNHPNVKLDKQLDKYLLNILGSPVHLSKTVMNLVSNAAEAMPDGGEIRIDTQNSHLDRAVIGYDDISKGDYVMLTVKDTGIGISADDIERIFEPFYTKKTMGRSGTGLGMAVVWGTVKDHRGYIDINSRQGIGTEVKLFFPITRRELIKDQGLFSLKNLQGNGETILVVDDVAEQREIASEILQKLGYSVKVAASGEEAVSYLHNHVVDLCVLDMIMEPGMDGLETYKQILEIHPGQKIIITSGYSESMRVKEAQQLGAGAYVKKPYLLEKIGRAVRSELKY